MLILNGSGLVIELYCFLRLSVDLLGSVKALAIEYTLLDQRKETLKQANLMRGNGELRMAFTE
jgi:hypothetical protein